VLSLLRNPGLLAKGTFPVVRSVDDVVGKRLTAQEVESVGHQYNAMVLDIRERTEFTRDHSASAVNIPKDELPIRSRYELPKTSLVVTDCSNLSNSECDAGMQQLKELGFKAAEMNYGRFVNSCRVSTITP
jgi:rhodanese-related sulfurtransferase